MKHRAATIRLGVVLAVSLPAVQRVVADTASWWDPRWPWRRLVLVSPPRTNLPGQEAAWVEFLTHGAVKPDGSDIRVVTAAGQPVRFWVMQVGPDDRARVCFALAGPANKYFIYYGNPQAGTVEENWRPERGVLLEGWTYRGGAIATFDLTRETFRKAGRTDGRAFVPNIFLGHNPFGPPANYCHRYTGWLMIDRPGDYLLCTTSKDASFLLVDDQMVVQWPGQHGPVGEARYTGRIQLSRGLHKLTYDHVSVGPDGRAVAARQPPGTPAPVVIPPTAFAPITLGVSSDLDRYGTRVQADFSVEGPYESFFQDRYTFRYVFRARLSERPGAETRFEWDFGDGQAGDRENAEHVYLTPGMRTVTLTVRPGGRPSVIRNRIHVTRNWDRVVEPKLDPLDTQARLVAGYRFSEMSAADLRAAAEMLRRAGQMKTCLAVLAALPACVNQVKPEQIIEALPEVYTILVSEAGQPEMAARWFQAVEAKADDPGLKAGAGALAGRVSLEELGDLRGAEQMFERVVQHYGDRTRSPAIRQARIGLGDVYLRTGRYRRAEQAYEQAGTAADFGRMNIRVGSYARAVDDYIRRKEFQDAAVQLDRWEWDYPLEKLRGYSTLMRATLLSRQKRHAHLIRLVEGFPLVVVEGARPADPVDVIYLTVDPDKLPLLYRIDPVTGRVQSAAGTAFPPNAYGMEMGLLAVEAHAQLRQKDRARRELEVLIRLYPDSPLLGQARERLKEFGG
jgi:tetratricopeptide (TPR) repeat protein